MTSLSRSDKKSRIRAWQEQQRAEARALFPLPEETLPRFFERLDEVWGEEGCANDRRNAEHVARERGLTEGQCESLFEWCEENGGFCDCEIAGNAREFWEKNRART